MGCKWKYSDGSYCDRNSYGKRYCYYHKKITNGLIDESFDDPITTEPGLADQLAQEFIYLPQLISSKINYHDRSELESEGYVALAEAIATYDPDASNKSFKLWAWYKIKSRMVDFIRKREKFNPESYDVMVETIHDPVDLEEYIVTKDILESDLVQNFILNLTPRELDVFHYTVYHKYDEQTDRELAEQWKTHHRSIQRDRSRLLKQLKEIGYELYDRY